MLYRGVGGDKGLSGRCTIIINFIDGIYNFIQQPPSPYSDGHVLRLLCSGYVEVSQSFDIDEHNMQLLN